MAIKVFGFKLSKKEWNQIAKPKKLIIIGLAALAIHFVLLAPFNGLWEGWRVVISAIGASIVGAWLE